MKKCRDVMTPDPVCCLPTDTVEKAAQLMKAENIGPIPVVENERSRKLIGIVTDRDLAIHVVAEGKDPKRTKVEEVMTSDPIRCSVDDDVEEALDKMKDYQVRRIPVVDEQDRVVGIIAQADVATRLKDDKETGEVVEEISESEGK